MSGWQQGKAASDQLQVQCRKYENQLYDELAHVILDTTGPAAAILGDNAASASTILVLAKVSAVIVSQISKAFGHDRAKMLEGVKLFHDIMKDYAGRTFDRPDVKPQ